jgi:hypothetical protein
MVSIDRFANPIARGSEALSFDLRPAFLSRTRFKLLPPLSRLYRSLSMHRTVMSNETLARVCLQTIFKNYWNRAHSGKIGALATAVLTFAFASPVHSQEQSALSIDQREEETSHHNDCVRRTVACVATVDERVQTLDDKHLRRRNLGLIVGTAAAVGLYGRHKWWQDGFSGDFKSKSEHWFGQNTYAGGMDKLGHFFMNYAGTRLLTKAFSAIGNDPSSSLNMAALLTLGTFTAVEVLDGYSKKWHFSKEDAVMNAVGAAAGVLFERKPELDRLFDIRIMYKPSSENGGRFEPFGDYSGQTYLLVAKANGIDSLREHPLLRYLEVAVGYQARGYSDVAGQVVEVGTRSVFIGISLNVSEVLRQTVFSKPQGPSRVQAVTDTVLEYIQIPGTAALGRIPLDE